MQLLKRMVKKLLFFVVGLCVTILLGPIKFLFPSKQVIERVTVPLRNLKQRVSVVQLTGSFSAPDCC